MKLSGEIFAGKGKQGYDKERMRYFRHEILRVFEENPRTQIALMPGGGNHGRGSELIDALGIDPLYAHYTGMIFLNANMMVAGNYLSKKLKGRGIKVREMTSLECNKIAEPYYPKVAIEHLRKGRLIVLGGGSGEGFKSTDLAATIKALELECDILVKGTKEEGVYDRDPKEPGAEFVRQMTHDQFREMRIRRIFDEEGIVTGAKGKLPIRIFNFFTPGNLAKVIGGEDIGTLITHE